MGKTAKQMKDAMGSQRISKEALKSIPRVPYNPHGFEEDIGDTDEEDRTNDVLYLFPHPTASTFHEATSRTYSNTFSYDASRPSWTP